jgi:hypothetical protein
MCEEDPDEELKTDQCNPTWGGMDQRKTLELFASFLISSS